MLTYSEIEHWDICSVWQNGKSRMAAKMASVPLVPPGIAERIRRFTMNCLWPITTNQSIADEWLLIKRIQLLLKHSAAQWQQQSPALYTENYNIQGDHHNGDQAAQRLHILWSICVHSIEALLKTVWLFIAPLHNQPMYPKMCSIDI